MSVVSMVHTPSAEAACSNAAPPSGTAVSCSGAVTTSAIAQTSSTGVGITADATSLGNFVHATAPVVFSVDTSSTITNNGTFSLTGGGGTGTARGAVLLGTGNNNVLINGTSGVITTTGAFNDGMAANGSGNSLTNNGSITTSGPNAYGMTAAWGQTNVGQSNNALTNTGSVSTAGSNARAASILGGNGTINNSGQLTTTGSASPTAYMQGNNDSLINTGTITATGSSSDAVFSNTAGSSFTASIENRAGGTIISQGASGIRTLNGNTTIINAGLVQSGVGTAITMGNGNDSLILQTGSVINGSADGGAGTNTVTLQGTGTASNVFTNFQTLLMQGTLWDWTGSGAFTLANVQTGTLNLTGTLGASASVVVDPNATLQASAQNLPLTITDNGLVRFAQDSDGTYSGLLSGTGAVAKVGNGTLILTADNPYSGGTEVTAGTLAIGDASHQTAALSGGGATVVDAGATLGGYGNITGNVTNNGTIAVANALPLFSGQSNGRLSINGALTNAGLAQIGNGNTIGNTLTVSSYTGQSGTVALNTFVAGDGAASDKLVINGGTATGSSALRITNIGGAGAVTLTDGIPVILATNGATTQASAFSLAAPVKAGAYEYYLAKGGVTAGTTDNWYLRNTVAAQSALVATTPGSTTPVEGVPIAAPGTPALPSALAAGSRAIPLYRAEVPVYSAIPNAARELGIMQVDTFHDRQGEQSMLTETGTVPGAWGRVWGGHSTVRQSGDAMPEFDASVIGAQVGHDVYADTGSNGQRNHYGFFVGFARATGDVSGFALGSPNLDVGHLAVDAYNLGAYWTHIGQGGWYSDAVIMGSSLVINPSSRDGIDITTHGHAVTGSLEGGLPIPLGDRLVLEPQAQLIWQHLSINDLNDGISNVTFNSGNTFLARVGARLSARYDFFGKTWQPYFRMNVLRSFGVNDKTTYGGVTPIGASVGQTAGQIGGGVEVRVTKQGKAFATVSYTSNLGGEHQRTVMGNAGVRWAW